MLLRLQQMLLTLAEFRRKENEETLSANSKRDLRKQRQIVVVVPWRLLTADAALTLKIDLEIVENLWALKFMSCKQIAMD